MTEFTVKDVTLFRVATFLSEALCQIKFLRNLRNIQHNFNDFQKTEMPNVISINNNKI